METEVHGMAEGRMSVLVNADNSFSINVVRAADHERLTVHGTAESSAPVLMREVISWLFGMSA
jgi:hypothetical protein